MSKIKQLIQKLFSYSIIRFIFVGGIATTVNFSIYYPLVYINTNPTIAYLMAFTISIICNYFLSSYFTFQVKPELKRALQFLGAHLINLGNELLILNVLIHSGVNKYYAPLLVLAIAFPLNFVIVRYALKGNFILKVSKLFGINKATH